MLRIDGRIAEAQAGLDDGAAPLDAPGLVFGGGRAVLFAREHAFDVLLGLVRDELVGDIRAEVNHQY
jgi:hypothetical protein